jgi:hypothetical protein
VVRSSAASDVYKRQGGSCATVCSFVVGVRDAQAS